MDTCSDRIMVYQPGKGLISKCLMLAVQSSKRRMTVKINELVYEVQSVMGFAFEPSHMIVPYLYVMQIHITILSYSNGTRNFHLGSCNCIWNFRINGHSLFKVQCDENLFLIGHQWRFSLKCDSIM
jgi:hypothetical protein